MKQRSGMETSIQSPFVFKEETFRIRGAAFHVYRTMGSGYLEAVYEECLAIEFAKRDIQFERQRAIRLTYEGVQLRQYYVSDFVCFGAVLLEIKAQRALAPEHRAQVLNYLKGTALPVGLLMNFGSSPLMELERFALTEPSASSAVPVDPTSERPGT